MITSLLNKPQRRVFATLLFLGLTLAQISANASTPATILDNLSLPQGTSLEIVSTHAVHNGVPQAIASLHSTQSIDGVLAHYRKRWGESQGGGRGPVQRGSSQASTVEVAGEDADILVPAYVESELPQWHLISRLRDGYNTVVQLNKTENGSPTYGQTHGQTHGQTYGQTYGQPQGQTYGFVSVRAVNVQRTPPERGVFEQLDLLSSNRTVDGVDTSLLRVYASSLSVANTYKVYRRRLIEKGWGVLADSRQDNNQVLILTLDQSRLELSFMASQEYASVLVAHRVTSE